MPYSGGCLGMVVGSQRERELESRVRAYCEAGAACVATTAFECPPKLRFPPNREPSIEPPLAGPVGPAVPMVCLGYLVLPRVASVQRLGGLRGDLGVHQ